MDPHAAFRWRFWLVISGLALVIVLLYVGVLGPYPGHFSAHYPSSQASGTAAVPADYTKYQAVLGKIQAASSFQAALAVAVQAGLRTSSSSAPGALAALISDPVNGKVLAAIKEYDDNLVFATSTASSSPADGQNAQVVSLSVPTTMIAGRSYTASVTLKNIGNTSWSAANNYRLGSQNPQDNTRWGLGRVALGAREVIAPLQAKTFSFTVTAPKTPGVYPFAWQMLQEGRQWFGGIASATVTVKAASGAATPIAESLAQAIPQIAHAGGMDLLELFAPLKAEATMAVGNDTGRTAVCSLAGTGSGANVMVYGDGQIYGVDGNYNFSVSCAPGISECSDAQAAASEGNSNIESFGGFTSNPLPSRNQIQVQLVPELIGGSTAQTRSFSTLGPDGEFNTSCIIEIALNISNPFLNETTVFSHRVIEISAAHEIGHCLGLSHNDATRPGDIMNHNLPDGSATIDPDEVQFLRDRVAGTTMQVEDCEAFCNAGEGLVLQGAGAGEISCVEESELCDGRANTTWDEKSQSCVSSDEAECSWTSGDPDATCTQGTTSCSCGADGVTCTDETGEEVIAPAGVCQGECTDGEIQQADGSCFDYCASNPDDTYCEQDEDYCAQNPDDPDCEDYCAQNPDDSDCLSGDAGNGNGTRSGGGGGGGCDFAGDPVGSILKCAI